MESTWLSLVESSLTVTSTSTAGLSYIIDVVGNSELPPVGPAHCSNVSGTNCSYTAPSSGLLPSLTTGEMEYLIEQVISSGLISASNIAIQNQGLEANMPENNVALYPKYATDEIPFSMNALAGTSIGYQSGGTTIVTAADKSAYLASITMAPPMARSILNCSWRI